VTGAEGVVVVVIGGGGGFGLIGCHVF